MMNMGLDNWPALPSHCAPDLLVYGCITILKMPHGGRGGKVLGLELEESGLDGSQGPLKVAWGIN